MSLKTSIKSTFGKCGHNFTSKVYRCQIMHQRRLPASYAFRHRVFMLYLNLDEIDLLAAALPLFSRNRFNLFSFYDSDHLLANSDAPLKDRMLHYLLAQQVISAPTSEFDGSIFLLTYPRILGYVFNPVSFYFVFDKQHSPLAAVAEVGNTFGEMKMYLLGGDSLSSENIFNLLVAKHFYVSPFSRVADYFQFILALPQGEINLSVNTLNEGNETLLVTNVKGQSAPIANLNLSLFLQYPLLTLKVITAIHLHALMLWLKQVPFFAKLDSDSPQMQIDVLNRSEKEHKHVEVESRV